MHSEDIARWARGDTEKERVAVIGIATLTPRATGPEEYWNLVRDAGAGEADAGSPALGATGPARWTPDTPEIDVARFGIPPVQAGSLARLQVLMLDAAARCLADAGAERGGPDDRTDVVVGTCFGLDRQYANALRIAGSAYAREVERAVLGLGRPEVAENAGQAAEELRDLLRLRFGAAPHDRVGEMASTIPARIAGALKLRGRTLAVESADATSFVALDRALGSLRAGLAERALVVTGQRCESGLFETLLRAKGAETGSDAAGEGLSEAVGALLLKPVATAVQDGDRIYAVLGDCRVRHHGAPAGSGHETGAARHSELFRALADGAGDGDGNRGGVQYVERATGATGPAETAELHALHGVFAEEPGHAPRIGSVRERVGRTFAHAGLAAVTTVALALYHRTLPAHHEPGSAPVPTAPWERPRDGSPRRAVVSGASLTGTLAALVVEEYVPPKPPVPETPAPETPAPETPWRQAPPARPASPAPREPVAVVAYGGRFADATDADTYWQAMLTGEDRLRPVPEDRLDRELHFAPGELRLTHSYTELGGYASVPEEPPPGVTLSPERWAAADPAQRMLLAVSGELFARRGPDAPRLTGRGLISVGSNLGLTADRQAYVAGALRELEEVVEEVTALKGLTEAELTGVLETAGRAWRPGGAPEPTGAALDGALASGTAALLAEVYELDAVPVAVEAACASSLAALDTALTALRDGSADYALAGGVELPCSARDMVLCSALGLLSHSRITPFDSAADGFTPGDGAALFLLKRRSDAERDGDEIVALLTGSGASNDVKSLIAPDAHGQERAMRQAFAQVGHAPQEVDYVEAHGTGTKVGDRVEIAATGHVYGGPERDRPLEIGSAKGFVGHTFAAAGSAGLLRTLLALRHAVLPPNANLRAPNPALELESVPAVLGRTPRPWPSTPRRPRRAAVSSFGTGGINYHLLVEEYRPDRAPPSPHDSAAGHDSTATHDTAATHVSEGTDEPR